MVETLQDYLGNNAWVGQVFLVVLGTGVVYMLVRKAMRRLASQLLKTNNLYDDALLEAGRRPLVWTIWLLGVSWAAELAGGAAQAEIFGYVG